MSNINPFLLKNPIFTEKFQLLMPTKYNDLVTRCFYEFVVNTLSDEHHAASAYPILLERFRTGYYDEYIDHLSTEDKKDIENYFIKMIDDEANHATLFNQILNKTYQIEVEIHDNLYKLLYTEDFFKTLTRYYVGECHLWVSFYKIFQETGDPELKKLFHQLLVDESHHNNSIRKIFKKIKQKIEFDIEYFNQRVIEQRYFGLSFIQRNLRLPGKGTKQDCWWEKVVFDNNWQQHFNELFIKKCYQVVSIFDTEIEYCDYKKIINQKQL